MSALVMLRWILPADRPYEARKDSIESLIAPAIRASGWLCGPSTSHHVRDLGSEAWLTVITTVDDATDVQDELTELLRTRAAIETSRDALLAPDAEWYRLALQAATHVGLDVLEARGVIPLTEHEAFARPSAAGPILWRFLNRVSPSYRHVCANYEAMERFWLDFFRAGPTPVLPPSGHCLWNLSA